MTDKPEKPPAKPRADKTPKPELVTAEAGLAALTALTSGTTAQITTLSPLITGSSTLTGRVSFIEQDDQPLSPGLAAVLAERLRVINDKGRTAESDDLYVGGELVQAAACYAAIAAGGSGIKARAAWPFDLNAFKPGESTRDLIKSAQFLIAELDRRARLGDPALTPGI